VKICDLQTGTARLQRAATDLKDQWMATRTHWSDNNCRQFEQQFLQPLGPLIQQTLAAIHRISDVLEKAEHDCSDPERPDWGL
jgi:hypothetical protein